MAEINSTFEDVWVEIVKNYKEDWREHIVESEDGGLDSYPSRYFSESDIETDFLCNLRKEFGSGRFRDRKIYVRNQFRFGYTTFRDQPGLSERIKRLYIRSKEEIGKSTFIPDLVIDDHNNEDSDSFLIFAEVKYWVDTVFEYKDQEKISSKYQKEIERLRTQCQILELTRDEKVCENAYLCIISDGYASDTVMKGIIDSITKEFTDLHFLIGGMSIYEKKEILASK